MSYEVETPILNSPFSEPKKYWFIQENTEPELKDGRRPSVIYPPDEEKCDWELGKVLDRPNDSPFYPGYYMTLVNQIRNEVKKWRENDYAGATATTLELLKYWQRDGRSMRLFYAQLEAVETIIFLTEARQDFLQGIKIPIDQPIDQNLKAFTRYACKMATGTGKTTVMAMLIAWSILNKIHKPTDKKFSDAVLIVCPNVTIRGRLQEINPGNGEASLYRTRDLVPPHLMDKLRRGKILITNWHNFELRSPMTAGSDPAKVVKVGRVIENSEIIKIASKNETGRGGRYLTEESLQQQILTGSIEVLEEIKDKQGNLKSVRVKSTRHVESDTAWIKRILSKDIGDKKRILVLNDEAHHAYRIQPNEKDTEETLFDDDEILDYEKKEATIWIEGLDRIHQKSGINFCVDLSATPYYLTSAGGKQTNKPFPWVVSDFSLMDAIESGLVKIPQLPIRDTTGKDVQEVAYYNIWQWILKRLTPAEKGKKGTAPKPEAVLKYAQQPITMLAQDWEIKRQEWEADPDEKRPPVLIIVCKNTKIAAVIYDWLAEDKRPANVSPMKLDSLKNQADQINTIRVDSKVIEELESGNSKSDDSKWMRFTLDTIGKINWPQDSQNQPIYPDGFADLAKKLDKPLHPPGRDIRCIISVGMLTEGWDTNTVTHIIGIRPFMSQLLCEQVVGRGLRRRSYILNDDELLGEEIATIFGVPFQIVPYKSTGGKAVKQKEKRHHIYAVPSKVQYKIEFPRVEGYTQAIRNRVTVDWQNIPPLTIDPYNIPPEVEMKANIPNNQGKHSLLGPGAINQLNLNPYRKDKRLQELIFELATDLTKDWCKSQIIPAHVLFPQLLLICDRYVKEKISVVKPCEKVDLYLSPYYGWIMETLSKAIQPDIEQGETPEVPKYESHRGPGSTENVDFFTSKDVRNIVKSHLNCVVADTLQWEQAAAYIIDTHPMTAAFVKNVPSLGFTIKYFHNGEDHDYLPDFLIKLNTAKPNYLILETKGYDLLRDVKKAAAERWINAVNHDGKYGYWQYVLCRLDQVQQLIDEAITKIKT